MTQLKKIAMAVECCIDFEEAQRLLKDRWYGDDDHEDIPYERWSRTFFAQLPPRKGVMGFINDLRDEGGEVKFFTNTQDHVQGARAELWLREWTADAFLVVEQTGTPGGLDSQVIFIPEDSKYAIPAGRIRVATVPSDGLFVPEDYSWALDSESDGIKPSAPRSTKKAGSQTGTAAKQS